MVHLVWLLAFFLVLLCCLLLLLLALVSNHNFDSFPSLAVMVNWCGWPKDGLPFRRHVAEITVAVDGHFTCPRSLCVRWHKYYDRTNFRIFTTFESSFFILINNFMFTTDCI